MAIKREFCLWGQHRKFQAGKMALSAWAVNPNEEFASKLPAN